MVVGSLGKILLLRQEDQGEIFYATEQELAVPDFRIVLMDRTQLLVEVKNHYQDRPEEPHVERWDYLEKLRTYSELMRCEIVIATYWVRYNVWTLVPLSAFERDGDKAALGFGRAMAANEMSRVGDLLIGTRWPLGIRLSGTFAASSSSATTLDGCFGRAPASGPCGARARRRGYDGSDGTRSGTRSPLTS
jgi:hypothetical protein